MTDRRVPPTVTRSPGSPACRRTLLAVLLVVTAGCGALPAGTDQPTAADTLTPVPVPNATDDPGPDGESLPPGVSANGTLDVDRLARAHADALAGTSYTETVERAGTTLVPRRTVYSDPQGTYLRVSDPNRTRVVELNGSGRVPTPETTVSRFLDGPAVDVTPVERRGTVLYRLPVPPDERPGALEARQGTVAASNVSVTALVARSGFVRELSMTYDRDDGARRQRVRIAVEYTGLGTTDVSRPSWVPVNESRERSVP
ncbi:hypothetical protein BRC67_03580 [Halobacteriales archaeon QH_3_68_24]|nr:MAG: hypothetical protein BRC67_03580 [Halobacteriales archaeon QH_3_68_24]